MKLKEKLSKKKLKSVKFILRIIDKLIPERKEVPMKRGTKIKIIILIGVFKSLEILIYFIEISLFLMGILYLLY